MAKQKWTKLEFMPEISGGTGLVYSTDLAFSLAEDALEPSATLAPEKQNLRLCLDRLKGNKKAVRIYAFVGTNVDLAELAKHLKTKCACGGTVKDGEIILQGDLLEKVKTELGKEKYRFKVVGG